MRKKGLIFIFLFFLMVSFGRAAGQGKIAIAAEGKNVSSKVSSVAARSPYFLIFDKSGKLLEAVNNPYQEAKGGAGTSVVPFLAQKGVTVVVAGEFGARMIDALKSKGMRYLGFKGSAEEALKKVLEAKE